MVIRLLDLVVTHVAMGMAQIMTCLGRVGVVLSIETGAAVANIAVVFLLLCAGWCAVDIATVAVDLLSKLAEVAT
jgi:hypothetical protein